MHGLCDASHPDTNIEDASLKESAVCIVEKKRGFKPSDRHHPQKKQFLLDLSNQIWQKNLERSNNISKKIDLNKIFTPATDAVEILPKHRKLYASSAFYSPVLHPTVEDQVELARRISRSLSDVTNEKSKGQSMYVNRKQRSVKWIHEGYNQDTQQEESTTTACLQSDYNGSNANKDNSLSALPQEQSTMEDFSQLLCKTEKAQGKEQMSPLLSYQNKIITDYQPLSLCLDGNANTPNIPDQMSTRYSLQSSETTSKQSLSDYKKGLAYKPRIPQGWKFASTSLSNDLFMPMDSALNSQSTITSASNQYSCEPNVISGGNFVQIPEALKDISKISTCNTEFSKISNNDQRIDQCKPYISFSPLPSMCDNLVKFENASYTPNLSRRMDHVSLESEPPITSNRLNNTNMPYSDF